VSEMVVAQTAEQIIHEASLIFLFFFFFCEHVVMVKLVIRSQYGGAHSFHRRNAP
jgi:hypothetical protein